MRHVKKCTISILLTLLLLSLIDLAAVSLLKQVTASGAGSYDSWPMFRHDESHAGFSNSNVSETIVQLPFSFSTGGKVRSSPAVLNGTVYVGSLDGFIYMRNTTTQSAPALSVNLGPIYSSPAVTEDRVYVGSNNSYVYALDCVTLAIKWYNKTGGAVASSPVVYWGILYVGCSDGYLYAWNASTGTELWRFWTNSEIESSPAFFGGTIFFGTNDNRIYALESSGRIKWYSNTSGAVVSSPAVANGTVYVGSNDTNVYAFDATTGAKKWDSPTGGAVTSSPAVAYDMVFVGSNDNRTYAFNATTGEQVWNYTTRGAVSSSPAVSNDGKVFVGSCDDSVYGLNAFTGIKIREWKTNGPVCSSPAIANGTIFVGSDDNSTYVFGTPNMPPVANMSIYPVSPVICNTVTFDGSNSFDPDGNINKFSWDFGDGSAIAIGNWQNASRVTHVYTRAGNYQVKLTVTDNGHPSLTNWTSQSITVLEAWPMFRHDSTHAGNSTSLAPVTNQTLWNQTIGPDASSDSLMYPSPAVIDGVVYIGSTNGTVYALNAADGTLIWNSTPGGHIHSSPAVVDGMVFIGSDDLNVYALNATNGNFVWKYTATGQFISSPVVAYGKVFIASRDGWLYALPETDPDSNGIIDQNEVKWMYRATGQVESSPTIADSTVFLGSLDHKIYALLDDPNGNGIIDPNEVKWIRGTGDSIYSSPAVSSGRVFVGSNDGHAYALNETNGNIIWNCTIAGHIYSSPAVTDGLVVIGSDDGNLYALNATTNDPKGEEIWKKQIGFVQWSSPAVAEGKVFIGTTDGTTYALREKDGGVWWSYNTSGAIDSSAAVLNDTLYVSSKDGKLYAFYSQVHNIAVTNVTSPKTEVVQNHTVTISAVLWNKGSFNETDISITASNDGTVFYSTSIGLTRGEEATIQIPWNTTGANTGDHVIGVNATLTLAIDEDPTDNNKTCQITVVAGAHDIAVVNVTTCKDGCSPMPVVSQNYTAPVYVTFLNKGNFTESFNTTAYANTTIIASQNVTPVPAGNSTTVTLTWNTTGFAYGNYTISAYAWPVPGETNTANNNFTGGVVTVTIPGDVNGDGVVNIFDAIILANAFNSTPSPNWNANADINSDFIVDIFDAIILANHYNQHYP